MFGFCLFRLNIKRISLFLPRRNHGLLPRTGILHFVVPFSLRLSLSHVHHVGAVPLFPLSPTRTGLTDRQHGRYKGFFTGGPELS